MKPKGCQLRNSEIPLTRTELLDRLVRPGVRYVRLAGCAVSGKRTLLEAFLKTAKVWARVDCSTARSLPAIIDSIASQRNLARDESLLLKSWERAREYTLVLEHLDAADDPPAASQFVERIRRYTAPTGRVVVSISSHGINPFAAAPPHETVTLFDRDLALTKVEVDRLFEAHGWPVSHAEEVYAATGGWLALVLSFGAMLQQGPVSFGALRGQEFEAVRRFVYDTALRDLPANARSVLLSSIALPGVSIDGLRSISEMIDVARHVDDLARWNLLRLDESTGEVSVWSAVAAAALEHYRDELEPLQRSLAVRLQQLARSCAALDSLPARLAASSIWSDPPLWISSYAWRRHIVDARTIISEADAFLAAGAEAAVIEGLQSIRALAYLEAGEPRQDDRAKRNETYRAGAALNQTPPDAEGSLGTLYLSVSVQARTARARGDWRTERAMWQRLFGFGRESPPPIAMIGIYAEAAIGAWVSADDEFFEHCIEEINASGTSPLARACQQFARAAAGHDPDETVWQGWPRIRARAYLVRAGACTDRDAALTWLMRALHEADRSGSAIGKILSRIAIAQVTQEAELRDRMLLQAQEVVSDFDSEPAKHAVSILRRGENLKPGTVFEAFVQRFRRIGIRSSATTELRLLSCEVLRNGNRVGVSDRVLEILVLLGASNQPMDKIALSEAFRPDDDPETIGNAIKMTVRRARLKLQDQHVIESTAMGYRLGEHVLVDLHELERSLKSFSNTLDQAQRQELMSWVRKLREPRPRRLLSAEWFAPIERRLQHLRSTASGLLASDYLSSGNFTDALQLAHWMILDDPLDETAREIAIRAHVCLGERSAAVRVLQEYATVLNDEDSGQPSAHLAALLHQA